MSTLNRPLLSFLVVSFVIHLHLLCNWKSMHYCRLNIFSFLK